MFKWQIEVGHFLCTNLSIFIVFIYKSHIKGFKFFSNLKMLYKFLLKSLGNKFNYKNAMINLIKSLQMI
jgi:hypothetical protein